MEEVCNIRKMTTTARGNRQKKGRQPKNLGTRLRCFGGVVDNGETFNKFREEEIAELLVKNTARRARIHLVGWHLFEECLLD